MSKTITIERDSGNVTIEQTNQTPIPKSSATEIMGVKVTTGHIISDIGVIIFILAAIYLGKKWLDKKWK
jgi:hypothetical protein|tara:strand:- start:11120 stop:11326 length:207 start_codon:yes stop_codon:yes gene_type:complete